MTVKASNDCGGFKPPKKGGHLDTQLFPECKGTETDRDVVKKTTDERKKKKKKKKSSGEELRRQVIAMLGPYASNWQFLQDWLSAKYFTGGNEPTPRQVKTFVDAMIGLVNVGGKDLIPLAEDDPRYQASWNEFKRIVSDFQSGKVDEREAARRFQGAIHTAKDIGVVQEGFFKEKEKRQQEYPGRNPFERNTFACSSGKCSASPKAKFNATAKKKKKEWNPNPWAVCHTTVDKDKDPDKFERCVQDVKKNQKAADRYRNIIKVAAMDVSELDSTTELVDYMQKHGYDFGNSNYPWGETPTFKSASGDSLYLIDGELVTLDRLKQWALYNWIPETPKEKIWAAENILAHTDDKFKKTAQAIWDDPDIELGSIEMGGDYNVLDVETEADFNEEGISVAVIYPQELEFYVPVSDEIADQGTDKVLNYVKEQTRLYDGSEWIAQFPYRDSMTGDIFVVGGDGFVVLEIGFAAITASEMSTWMKIPSADRVLASSPDDIQRMLAESANTVESSAKRTKNIVLSVLEDIHARSAAKMTKSARAQEEAIIDELLSNCSEAEVVEAIKCLGEVSIAGFSDVDSADVVDIILNLEDHELGEIWETVLRNRERNRLKGKAK